MANEEHVERLKHSVHEWNQWRQEHPEIRPDLSHAKLDHAILSIANLSRADLNHADLSYISFHFANLSGSDLSFADLSGADLPSGADLSGADLRNARLPGARLPGAHLAGTHLSHAILSGADLKGTDLSGALLDHAVLNGALLMDTNLRSTNLDSTSFKQTEFYHTLFAWVDLSKVKELETAKHLGPSGVDINSVTLPHDEPTRQHFLRGVGFTETQIEYLPSLLTPRPIEYASLFISYAHQDEIVAKRLYTDLRKKDVPCWFAPHDLRPGNYYRQGIDQAIHSQDKVLLLLSEHSVASGWVRYEVELALARENRQQREILFPIRFDDAVFHCTASWAVSLRETRQIGDFTGRQEDTAYQEAFTALLRHLKVNQRPIL